MPALYQTADDLLNQGWSLEVIQACHSYLVYPCDLRLGSPFFTYLWEKSCLSMTHKERLVAVMNLLQMPEELSGRLTENQSLIAKISPTLAPHDSFWVTFSNIIDQAFPQKSLSQKLSLNRRLHQFRYIISSHQANYVRRYFKKQDMTDADALVQYLRSLKQASLWQQAGYSFRESARLHNKLAVSDKNNRYPDDRPATNIKLLIHFHTEFIVTSDGYLLNETDAMAVTKRGIINGASFNYGKKGLRHWQLDVEPIKEHDPLFRKKCLKGYRSPNRLSLLSRFKPDFFWSYFNPRGFYSQNGCSRKQLVKKTIASLTKQL